MTEGSVTKLFVTPPPAQERTATYRKISAGHFKWPLRSSLWGDTWKLPLIIPMATWEPQILLGEWEKARIVG